MSEIENLDLKVNADASGLITAFEKSQAAVASFVKQLDKVGEKSVHHFTDMAKEIGKMATSFIAAQVSIRVFEKAIEGVEDGLKKARHISEVASVLDTTAESFQVVASVAGKFGVSMDEAENYMGKLNRSIGEAVTKGGPALDSFNRLGLSARELSTMPLEARFAAVAGAIQGLGNRTEQTAAAVDLFSRGANKMVALLAQGGDAFELMGKKARASGNIISDFDIEKVRLLAINTATLEKQMGNMKVAIASWIGGAIDTVKEQWFEFSKETMVTKAHMEGLGKILVAASALAINGMERLTLSIEATSNQFKYMASAASIALAIIAKGATTYAELWAQKGMEGLSIIKSVTVLVVDVFKWLWVKIKQGAAEAMTWISEKISVALRKLAELLSDMPGMAQLANKIKQYTDTSADYFKNMALAAKTESDASTATVKKSWDKLLADFKDGYLTWKIPTTPMIDAFIGRMMDVGAEGLEGIIHAGREWSHLKNPITAAKDAVDAYVAVMSKIDNAAMKKVAPGAVEGPIAPKMSSDEGRKFLEETTKALEDASAASASALQKENATYVQRLTMAEKFYAEERLLAGDAAKAIENIQTEHQLKASKLENANEQERLKRIAGSSNLEYTARIAAMEKLSTEQEKQRKLSLKANDMAAAAQLKKLEEQQQKTAEKGLLPLINYEEEKSRIIQQQAQVRGQIEENAALDSADTQEAIFQMKVDRVKGFCDSMSQPLGNLATLMQSQNQKLFNIGKVAALAQNVVDTISSAASSYKFGSQMGGPFLGAAFAATAVVAGAVRAQQIASAQIGGGGSVGSNAAGGTPTQTQDQQQAQPKAAPNQMNVTLYGESFSQAQVRGLIGSINEAVGNGVTLKAQVA